MSNVEVYVESQNDGKYTFILKDFTMDMGGGNAVPVGDISVPNIEFIDTTDENNMIFTYPETILDKTTGDVPLGYLPTYIDKSYFINKSKINSTIWTKWIPSEDSSIPIYINFEGDKDPTYTSIVDYSIDDILTISSEFITFRTNSQFVIYGVAGNVVKQGENTIVSLDGFNKGVYILSVQTANGVVSKKFSVK